MHVVRVYHGGRSPSHRARERALRRAGIDVTLVVPAHWPEAGSEPTLTDDEFPIAEVPVTRAGDVNRHAYRDRSALGRLLRELEPELLDVHEEPVSVAARQWLQAAPTRLPVVMYTAQNVDKRYPPPFAWYERRAYGRVNALYPCSAQAASVARGKGFAGPIEVLPLGFDDTLFRPGSQSLGDDELVLGLFGRLVPEKGASDAIRVLAQVNATRPARLLLVGRGPDSQRARSLAADLGIADRVDVVPWRPAAELAATYRRSHVVLVPSVPTATWVEQFGRVIIEAQASGAVVAAYASGAIPEAAGDAAVLVPPGAVKDLAERVIALLESVDDYEQRRSAGFALARERTWDKVARRQADLYRRVAAGEAAGTVIAPSARARREAARREFGPTARTTAGERPFALPLLRRGGLLAHTLAAVVDAGAAARDALLSRRDGAESPR